MWKNSDPHSQGAHYSVMGIASGVDEMDALRAMFPKGEADEMNFVLFSTSGVHGTYRTIEEVEAEMADPPADEDDRGADVTFLIVQPRMVALRYGNCTPTNQEDIQFLKTLRASSHRVMATIGIAS